MASRNRADQLALFEAEAPAVECAEIPPPRAVTHPALSGPPVPDDLQKLAATLPPALHLGTSSWSFPGWEGIVYAGTASEITLSRHGLAAYGAHPLLRAVGIDRTFYAPLSVAQYAAYARQVPAHFRFLVKAPAFITDYYQRGERGKPEDINPFFLDPERAIREFIEPCLQGLGEKAGVLVFQLSPLARAAAREAPRVIEKLHAFLSRLPAGPCYAVEPRDPELVVNDLADVLMVNRARLCIGIHARMPSVAKQAALLERLPPGPLVVRWSLHAGYAYEEAKAHYAPFNRLMEEDVPTRTALAALAARYLAGGQQVYIVANNKAEGSAPLTCFALARAIAEQPPS